MKIKGSWTFIFLITGLFWFLGFVGSAGSEVGANVQTRDEAARPARDSAGYLEKVAFEKLNTKERVTISLSRQSGVRVENASLKSVRVTLDNVFIPDELKKALGEDELQNILRVLPAQKAVKGSLSAILTIELKRLVPYRVLQEGQNVMIDFDVASLPKQENTAETISRSSRAALPASAAASNVPASDERVTERRIPDKETKIKDLRQNRITLDFQDANIKAVLRLMSEQGGVNIVSGDDVKGNITVYVQDLPWDQALDAILSLSGLIKEERDNVMIVRTPRAKNLVDTDRVLLETTRRKLEDDLILELSKKGLLKQVTIEAKIVEVNDEMSRSFGIQWGYGSSTTIGSANYPFGVLAGTNPPSQTSGLTSLTTGVALTKSALALSWPSTTLAPSIGIITGSAYSLFQAQLSALETISKSKIISTPRVVTMEGKKAIIRQGSEIPVVTPATANSPATTTYKPAELKLEVEPKVTKDNRISMIISANNDRPDTANKDATTGNFPVLTNKIESSVVVKDGDTVVIGGILRTEETKQVTGVPWLSEIPVLGWLFKQEAIGAIKKELLIFITPRLIKDNGSVL